MNVTIIGAGNMGGAIARGLATADVGAEITCVDPSAQALQKLDGLGIHTTSELSVEGADVVIFAVKPWLVEELMSGLKLDFARQIFFSVAAGVTIAELDHFAGTDHWARFRVMPNTAIEVGRSMTFVAHNGATETQIALADKLWGALGQAAFVPEQLMEAGMAVASCGIAFAMRYVRAAMSGAIEAGLSADAARQTVLQTVRGAVELLEASDFHPEAEIDRVTTPGGYTIRGLAAMESAGFTAAVQAGIRAAKG